MALGLYHPPEKETPKTHRPGFLPSDRKVANHNKTKMQLEKVLKSSKYTFNIMLLEYMPKNYIQTQVYIDLVKKFCLGNRIPMQGRITFAKNRSTGDPLTPWMQLHNIGHALMNVKDEQIMIKYLINSAINPECQKLGIDVTLDIPYGVFLFKSARMQNINYQDELVYELIAEYLWNGKIRISPKAAQSEIIKNTIQEITKIIEGELSKSVGGVIVDFMNDLQ